MEKVDIALVNWRDVPAAIGLLTRLPVPVNTAHATARGARAAWAYPLAGLAVALLLGLIGWLTGGLLPQVQAAVLLAVMVVVTGALHEDGLADTADGLWGGWDKARRLEIMKDSRIGAYGVIALVVTLLLRWICLSVLLAQRDWVYALVAVAVVSRAPMVVLMAVMSNARGAGLSQSVGRPTPATAGLAVGLAMVAALLCLGWSGLVLCAFAAIATACCGAIAQRKIGGQTGDILGASQQISEITLLIVLTAG